jgi:hypothetical protein
MTNPEFEATAKRMIGWYGEHASIHATYNLMNYDRGTEGYKFWSAVIWLICEEMESEP